MGHGLLGRILRANDDASHRFGPNTAEVEAFIHAVAHLTPWQWRQVIAARALVSTVTNEDSGPATQSVKAIQAAIRSTDGRLAEPMMRAGEALLQALAKSNYLKAEEAAALIGLRTIPTLLSGDAGWGAVRTVTHGGRVLGARGELTREMVVALWAPLEAAVPLASVEEAPPKPGTRVRAAVARAAKAIKAPALAPAESATFAI